MPTDASVVTLAVSRALPEFDPFDLGEHSNTTGRRRCTSWVSTLSPGVPGHVDCHGQAAVLCICARPVRATGFAWLGHFGFRVNNNPPSSKRPLGSADGTNRRTNRRRTSGRGRSTSSPGRRSNGPTRHIEPLPAEERPSRTAPANEQTACAPTIELHPRFFTAPRQSIAARQISCSTAMGHGANDDADVLYCPTPPPLPLSPPPDDRPYSPAAAPVCLRATAYTTTGAGSGCSSRGAIPHGSRQQRAQPSAEQLRGGAQQIVNQDRNEVFAAAFRASARSTNQLALLFSQRLAHSGRAPAANFP